jgi:hypothetical protein
MMRDKLESVAQKVTWDHVVSSGILAVLCLLGVAAWANEATRNYASCDPPGVLHIKPGRVYTCPTRYMHTWTVHTHAALVRGLLGGALALAMLAVVLGLTLARRRRPPVVGDT